MLTFTNAIIQFTEVKRAVRLSPNTLNDYANTYRKFAAHLGTDPPVDLITPDHIIRFLASDPVQSVSAKTARNYHTGLSSLWTWLVKAGVCQTHILHMVDPPRSGEKQIEPYTRTDILLLLAAVRSGDHPDRDRAIILTLLDTGIRASELAGLRIGSISITNRQCTVTGKGDKQRIIKYSIPTLEAIKTYLTGRAVMDRRSSLFATENGKPMTRDCLRLLMDRLSARSEVHAYCHRFRHTFAIQFLRNGGNIYTLQRLLGHTTLEMVKRYLSIAQCDLDRDHDRASPVVGWGL